MDEMRSLHVEMRAGEEIQLDGGRIKIQLIEKSGKVAQFRVTAPQAVAIQRPGKPAVSSGATQARMGFLIKA